MLSLKDLGRMQEAARETSNLTVYVSAVETDPAAQRAWMRRAQNAARAERQRVEQEAPDELDAFDMAWGHVESALPSAKGALGSIGWAVFSNPTGVLHSSPLPMAFETAVTWGPGIRVRPYVRVVARALGLLLVLADVKRARLFRIRGREIAEVEDLLADRTISDRAGPGMMKSASGSTGVRGETRRDAAQRTKTVHTERLARDLRGADRGPCGGRSRNRDRWKRPVGGRPSRPACRPRWRNA